MLTVLLSTRNRAEILSRVLESFSHLQQPSSGWKLVIVDNGSADHTPSVIASFANRLPLHVTSETRLGKNFALNTGIELVEGDLVVFTDDDVFPHAEWLVELRKAADAQPSYSMFGGVILPRWESMPPRWLKWVDEGPAYALTDRALKEGPIPVYLLFGPNMAVRVNVFQFGIRFDTSIGPRGANYAMGSETELTLRLDRLGNRAWHVPTAVVEHFIRAEQLTKRWIWGRAMRFGRGQYRLFCAGEVGRTKSWVDVPWYLLRWMVKQCLLMGVACISFRREALFRSRWTFHVVRGMALEARIIARERSMNSSSRCSA